MDNYELPMELDKQANGDEIRLDMFPLDKITKKVLRPDWTFKDSFPGLDLFPFNQLAVEDACFIYAPQEEAEYKPWEDGPTNKQKECIPMQKGLNFAAWIKLDGFSSILTLLGNLVGANSTFKFYGPFNPNQDEGYAGTVLFAELSNGDFPIGCEPLTFTLSRPRIVVKVAEGEDGAQDIGLAVHADSSLGLDFSVGISATGDRLTFGAEPNQGKEFTIENMLDDLPGGIGDFQSFLPDEFGSIFGPVVQGVGLKQLRLIMQTNTREIRYWEISVGTTMPWEIPNVVTLENLVLQVGALNLPGISNPLYMVSTYATARLLPDIFKGEFDFAISIEKTAEGKWQVSIIRGQYFGEVILGDIVCALLDVRKDTISAGLQGISFSDFGVIVHPAEGSYECYGACLAEFPLLGSQLRSSLVINVEYSKQGYKVYLGGVLEIAGQSFSLTVDFSGQKGGSSNLRLTASWEALSLDSYLQIEDIVRALGSTQDMPPGVDLSLKSASFIYDFKDQTLVLKAESMNYGKVVFAVCKRQETPQWQFFVGVAVNEIILPRLPLVDDMLRGGKTIKVDEIKLLGASTALDAKGQKGEIERINGLIGEEYPTIPDQGLPSAFIISAQLNLGGYIVPLSTGAAKQPDAGQPEQKSYAEEGQTKALVVQPTSQPSSGADSAAGEVTWFNVNKNIGPVSLQRVGAKYKDSVLWLLLDTSLAAAGLQLSVIGLAVGSPLGKLEPTVDISGLALSYSNPPLEITGAFVKMKENEYAGKAILKTDKFSLSAVGLYADLPGQPSMFVYAFLDYPLGGPPVFYVTGLAAGFGFNRSLVMPSIDKVEEFPLVAEACGDQAPDSDLGKELEKFGEYVPVQSGQYFLAAGVKFTSFKMIESFAMLAVSFGQRLQIDLIGMSTIKVPYSEDKTKPALSEIQVAFMASFIPDQGVVAVVARLTPSSYILSKDNHPTGGLAFYTWFAGDHNGDFVLSVGGYHSKFQVPAHYPQVPRLALSWQVSSCLSIKGDAYFALTPSMLMAGGNLEANWHSGPLEAWFKAQADFLIAWQPFHYDAYMFVNMGVAYTFQINTWFGSWTQRLTAELVTELHVWGPEFAGIARVRVSFISFDVAFSTGPSLPPPSIDWYKFKEAFLPKELEDVLNVSVRNGLISGPSNGTPADPVVDLGILDPSNISLVVDSLIPVKTCKVVHSLIPEEQYIEVDVTKNAFGIAPMGKPVYDTELQITITRAGVDQMEKFEFTPVLKNVPAGLWGTKPGPALDSEPMVKDVISGCVITVKLPSEGTVKAAFLAKPASVSPVNAPAAMGTQEITVIEQEPKEKELALQWESGLRLSTGTPATRDPRQTIRESLHSANGRRQDMLAALGLECDAITVKESLAEAFVAAPQIEG